MQGLIYLYQRTIVNRIKKAVKKPTTYVGLVFVVFYVVMIFWSFQMIINDAKIATPENMVTVLSCIILLILPGNVISYSKRHGLLFRPSEVHFVFQSPVSPKTILMFAGIKSFAGNLLIGIAIFVFGICWFHAGVGQMLLYFLFFEVFETILEASIIIFCYGNEKLHEKFFKGLTIVMYIFMAVIAGIGIYLLMTRKMEFSVIREYLDMPVIQLIPIVGWNIAVAHLIFVGPNIINVIGTALFLTSTLGMLYVARKMKCTGEYFEDAEKFADEIQAKRMEVKKRGTVSLRFGKKKKYREAAVEYKGNYAKAIYYRQLLEYKKNRMFIFGWNTFMCLVAGIVIGVYGCLGDIEAFGQWKVFIIPGIVAYAVFIFSGYPTKWSKELESPYTYLIPDTSLKKVWYSTKIEHLRALIDGILITVPGAITFQISPVIAVLTVLLYMCLMANRLYYGMLADTVIGKNLGSTGRSLIKMFLQGIAMVIAMIAAAVGYVVWGLEAGFFLMILFMALLTFAGAAVAALSFVKMEALD